MWKEGEVVNLNGKDYKISQIEWPKGHKACMQCASVNNRPPCIDAFDYPEKDDMFDLHKCIENMPEFYIPKIVKLIRVRFDPGPAKLQVIKVLFQNLTISLKQAKDYADSKEFHCESVEYDDLVKKMKREGAHDFVII